MVDFLQTIKYIIRKKKKERKKIEEDKNKIKISFRIK